MGLVSALALFLSIKFANIIYVSVELEALAGSLLVLTLLNLHTLVSSLPLNPDRIGWSGVTLSFAIKHALSVPFFSFPFPEISALGIACLLFLLLVAETTLVVIVCCGS